MKKIDVNLKSAQECITASKKLIADGKNETVIRDSFTSYLRLIFPGIPAWVERHIHGAESAVKITKKAKQTTGFVDNLVNFTAIEYEADLSTQPLYEQGLLQVKDYCASLLNEGVPIEFVTGVLSDTVRWFAFAVDKKPGPGSAVFTRDNVELRQIDKADLTAADETTAHILVSFLLKHLGRIGGRPLNAESIAGDLGFKSSFATLHLKALAGLVDHAFEKNPKYGELIQNLWCNFVSYFRDKGTKSSFNRQSYTDELYILTLGKLICANVIEKGALLSDDGELKAIIDGRFFVSRGLTNLVEFDYFGWLNRSPYVEQQLAIARDLQRDLQAYDFTRPPAEDVFGHMLAQLALRSQRILLGQEWTPGWLARQIVEKALGSLPKASAPQLVDMCCGSGAMIVETVRSVIKRLEGSRITQETKVQIIVRAITGFDIDPLAVILSKINWVLAARTILEPFGNIKVTIPVYHADSLFAITPLSDSMESEGGAETYKLKVAEYTIELPKFLVTPDFQPLFDEIVERAYSMASATTSASRSGISESAMVGVIKDAVKATAISLTEAQQKLLAQFAHSLAEKIDLLNRDGRNGIWIFILRNSYRPGLVSGQFNGLVSNPPWLALSKLDENPYEALLRRKAELFGIKPPGSSHLHIELATIFLLHAVDRYLSDNAIVGCITPETVLNGHHHNPFRVGGYASKHESDIKFSVEEIWRVQEGTFKNRAIVLIGHKTDFSATEPDPIPGLHTSASNQKTLSFNRHVHGSRTIWSDQASAAKADELFCPANFRQGADIMPRTFFLYETEPAGPGNCRIKSIDPITSSLSFAVKDAKKNQKFKISPSVVPGSLIFDVATSNLLTPFELSGPLKALLPIGKNAAGVWEFLDDIEIAAKGQAVQNLFHEILDEAKSKSVSVLEAMLNVRGKLTQQVLSKDEHIVVTGAGGGRVCCAYVPSGNFRADRLVIDQTLYFAQVKSEDEAIYLVGALNSEAVSEVIKEFQPKGEFGERHVHKLPFGVTPLFDATEASHQDVVEQTKMLLTEYAEVKESDADLQKLLNPNEGSLASRRRGIQNKLNVLASYADYDAACRSLYGV